MKAGLTDNTAGFMAGKASILSAHCLQRIKAGLTDNTAGEVSCLYAVRGG